MAGLLSVVLVGLVPLMAGPAFAHAAKVWWSDEEFRYGFAVVPTALGLPWLRWAELREALARGRPRTGGLLLVLLA